MASQFRAIFLSHGGGPLPLLGDAAHQEMVSCLRAIAAGIERPEAIVVVSAHWEASQPTVTSASSPGLIYDYSGFPAEAYSLEYPCAGSPALADAVVVQLKQAGLQAIADPVRGFDHGLFVPLKLMYPEADIPCIQLSLINSLDPQQHIDLGRALRGLTKSSLLLIGSGFSFHNMRAFFAQDTAASTAANQSFDSWLRATCSDPTLSEAERQRRLVNWSSAPGARFCHPREEHLLPLHVCYGYADAASSAAYELKILNKFASMFVWGDVSSQ